MMRILVWLLFMASFVFGAGSSDSLRLTKALKAKRVHVDSTLDAHKAYIDTIIVDDAVIGGTNFSTVPVDRGGINSATNWNNYVLPGTYSVTDNGAATNGPPLTSGYFNGVLIVNASGDKIVQQFKCSSSLLVYLIVHRIRTNDTIWGTWNYNLASSGTVTSNRLIKYNGSGGNFTSNSIIEDNGSAVIVHGDLSASSMSIAGNSVPTFDTGSFACTLKVADVTVEKTDLAFYTIIGNVVTISLPCINGTSNSVNLILYCGGIPAIIKPSKYVSGPMGRLLDNGTTINGQFIYYETAIKGFVFSKYDGSAWTNSGTKGIASGIGSNASVAITYIK
jgi:hypothetical protein